MREPKHPKWIPQEKEYTNAKGEVHLFPWEWIGSAYIGGAVIRMYKDTRTSRFIYTDSLKEKQGFQVQNLHPPQQEEVKKSIALQKMGLVAIFGEGLVGSRY